MLLTVGGVSVGDHDVVRPALEQAGVKLDFWRVAIKPGKPLAFGRGPRASVLGLPGNPASAIVTFTLFGMPLLRAMQGDARPRRHAAARAPRRRPASAHPSASSSCGRCSSSTAGCSPRGCTTTSPRGRRRASRTSDGLAFVPAGEGALEAGAFVDFLRWSDA